ncbi:unnamed protein product [Bemisia tabaci]|uniref:Vacuolar protein sorting-associated protein 51 homolog n=1 Tax=Bemisia tabaci TaxID=7038 RepID=A0A9P0A4X1_BEMTA|nr:unnamed protein product [Bemisia tabaci]
MEPPEKPRGSPFDINGPDFNPDLYLQKLFKECSLKHIMDCESEVVKDCQLLNSDMQTLVYENYNKFILATDTIKKMKTDFKKMEDEMEMLIQNMNSITSFSEMITSTLQGTHGQISKLSGVHALLKKLQFLFKLPGKLKLLLQEEDYEQAVQEFVKTQPILDYYGDLDSFQGIQKDCNDILQKLKTKLRDQLKNKDTSAKKLIKCIDLLLQLQEPSDQLCSEYLTFVDSRLAEQLSSMQITHSGQDAAEFMDSGANVFLTDLCLIVTSYTDMFLNRTNSLEDSEAVGKLNSFVIRNMNSYLEIVQLKLEGTSEEDTAVLVSALDRLYCRLQAFNSLFTHVDFTVKGMELIISAAHRQCRNHLVSLKSHFADSLARVKQSLAAPKYTSSHTEGSVYTSNKSLDLSSNSALSTELLTSLVLASVEKVKGILQDLLLFLQPELTFISKYNFKEAFCIDGVREGLVVSFLHHVTATVQASAHKVPLQLLLLLSKMCLEYESNSVRYLLNVTDEWFSININASRAEQELLSSEAEICTGMKTAAQYLMNQYVFAAGSALSVMVKKSVDTRDWFHCAEPRTVRAAMKRVIEDITTIDCQVGALFEEGTRTGGSSDSSRRVSAQQSARSYQHHSRWGTSAASQVSNVSLPAAAINKIFSQNIDIFAPIQFSRISILTGIINITLKALLECVRLKTFNKYGLQQVQVDTHYLKIYLWRFVADETVIRNLLDEVVRSVTNRCIDGDKQLMEHGILEIICEKG